MNKLFIGTSGYNYKDWKGIFYPEKLPQKAWLSFYSQEFGTVEINATFYGSFKRETIERWYAQTPSGFSFSIKGSRFITHIKRLAVTEKEITTFFQQVEPLKEKLYCILWQLPANMRMTGKSREALERLVRILPTPVRHAVEFRDTSWQDSSILSLLKSHSIGWVISDAASLPRMEEVTSDFVYIRFHGPGKLYASSYSKQELWLWAEKIQGFLEEHDVYCYFNNDYEGRAIENARTLTQLIQQRN